MRMDNAYVAKLKDLTVPQILSKHADAESLKDRVAIRKKSLGLWETVTWQEYFRFVKHVGLGLISLGIKRGDHIAMIIDNHPEWLFSELGAQAIGVVTLNLFTSSVAKDFSVLLNRFEAKLVIAQDEEQVDKLLEIREEIKNVIKVIYVDPTGMCFYNDAWLMSFKELLNSGKALDESEPDLFERELWKGKNKDINLMLMTSGTTGIPKFVMLTHANFVEMALKWMETNNIEIGDNWISITPTAWIVDQMWGVGVSVLSGMAMNCVETQATLSENFREIGPSIIITSSSFWEDLASIIRVKIDDSGFIKRKAYELGLKIGSRVVSRESKKESVPFYLRFLKFLFKYILYRPLLDRVGCLHFKSANTGGHPISPDVIIFFRSMGLNLKHCYGLSETCGIFQVQPDGEVKPETVGKPLPRTEVKITEDGQVIVRSPSVFVGYYKNEEETKRVLNDGWLYTGDAGHIDDDGHLIIIGRKEEITRLKEGEAFSPDYIETRLKFSPYIKEAVVFGEEREYVTGFICIDFGNVGSWAEARMIPYTTYTDLSQQPPVEELILSELRRINNELPKPMRLKKAILLYKMLDPDDEELTRTGKVRRKFIFQKYQDLVEAMYEGKKEIQVTGNVQYRDGHIGKITTNIRILDVE
ncbi:MAG TPA: long-chain fatty acid--CoA ligase [Deltaproteobacteria bacterium]|nr:long-chain fatty acid--CoA ligase [Deltaproteobacteria bacterium]